jgi:hypothetical protein
LEDRLIKRKTLSVALSHNGIRGGIAHLVTRVFGDPRFLRPASSIDFRHFGLRPSATLNKLIHSLAPQFTEPEIQYALDKDVGGVDKLMDTTSGELGFQEKGNAGRNPQYLLGDARITFWDFAGRTSQIFYYASEFIGEVKSVAI